MSFCGAITASPAFLTLCHPFQYNTRCEQHNSRCFKQQRGLHGNAWSASEQAGQRQAGANAPFSGEHVCFNLARLASSTERGRGGGLYQHFTWEMFPPLSSLNPTWHTWLKAPAVSQKIETAGERVGEWVRSLCTQSLRSLFYFWYLPLYFYQSCDFLDQ